MLRRLASLAGLALVLLIVTVACLEVALRLANALEIVTPQRRVTEAPFYQDRDRAFGVWHDPDRDYVPIAECFDVVYSSNSYGARDVERPRRSAAPRVVVLGDSFVEGIGVDREARMTDLLEGQTGIPHLNFGTAGAFSSTQEWKLYETLASDFDHEWLMLFAFPYNDFVENDHERWWEPERYRPYLRRTPAGGEFELFYPVAFEEAQERAVAQLGWNRLYNALFVYRLVAIVDGQLRYRMAEGAV